MEYCMRIAQKFMKIFTSKTQRNESEYYASLTVSFSPPFHSFRFIYIICVLLSLVFSLLLHFRLVAFDYLHLILFHAHFWKLFTLLCEYVCVGKYMRIDLSIIHEELQLLNASCNCHTLNFIHTHTHSAAISQNLSLSIAILFCFVKYFIVQVLRFFSFSFSVQARIFHGITCGCVFHHIFFLFPYIARNCCSFFHTRTHSNGKIQQFAADFLSVSLSSSLCLACWVDLGWSGYIIKYQYFASSDTRRTSFACA